MKNSLLTGLFHSVAPEMDSPYVQLQRIPLVHKLILVSRWIRKKQHTELFSLLTSMSKVSNSPLLYSNSCSTTSVRCLSLSPRWWAPVQPWMTWSQPCSPWKSRWRERAVLRLSCWSGTLDLLICHEELATVRLVSAVKLYPGWSSSQFAQASGQYKWSKRNLLDTSWHV